MDMNELFKQAQQFQQKLGVIQEEMKKKTVTGTAGGGMVNVVVNGNNEVLDLGIEAELLTQENKQMIEDLVRSAVNDGLRKAKELGKREMGKLTGGMNIPGLF
ncbi:MAG: YbaB/EbfC family nucleoid-associated protein [Desulfobulbus propionicus]|nr:MAG: YbaB/EbfC family nucleoid-associated protein [Desulfobulbus propionicus]